MISKAERQQQPLYIGPLQVRNRVFLAPMSGISDLPFRRLVYGLGAGLVVSEMIASEQLAKQRPDVILRSKKDDKSPLVIQLSGREAHWMAEGARMAEDIGADVIDINMGCPAKQVTRGLSGSALMRDEEKALELIKAVVAAVDIPVTLKMRMGWDEDHLNAPSLSQKAEAAGIQMITVHGRTRCQFFTGKANWPYIARIKHVVSIPVIANGDITEIRQLGEVLDQSQADGIMIGRGACGAPWFPGQAASFLNGCNQNEINPKPPTSADLYQLVSRHYSEILSHYGMEIGRRTARKHLGWYIENLGLTASETKLWRQKICREDSPVKVQELLKEFFDRRQEVAA